MNQETFLQRLETLGYYSLPRSHPKSPGYSGLLVVLRQAPQGHEPEWIQLRLYEQNGITSMVHLHADMNWAFSHIVCPGQIVVRSRQEPEAAFYTFGGTLETEALAGEMVFSLRSAAPVLELLPERETVADLLAEETEALFARAEAQQQLSSQELLNRLVKAGPEAVYMAVLQSLLPEDEAFHFYPEFVKMLNNERDWYQKTGRWPLTLRDLTILLQAMSE